MPRTVEVVVWFETWEDPLEKVARIEQALQRRRVLVRRGGAYDRWDLQAACGLFGGARLLTTVEEHGAGRQLLRVRARPRLSGLFWFVIAVALGAAVLAARDATPIVAAVFATGLAIVLYRAFRECSKALFTIHTISTAWMDLTNEDEA